MGNDEQQQLWEILDINTIKVHAERAYNLFTQTRNSTELTFVDDDEADS